MLKPKYSTAFKKDYKRLKKRKYDLNALKQTVSLLASGEPLPQSYR
ncbi:MAG: type II toxin-antitoxin system YafQ family toxin, partial [Oscillibacter sp.]|nr:type II toxin-antitoxin system YafQ family toxin [Oscillibacter sp.]